MFFFNQKTAYEMRISDWSSDVCSSELAVLLCGTATGDDGGALAMDFLEQHKIPLGGWISDFVDFLNTHAAWFFNFISSVLGLLIEGQIGRAHVELQSLMRISYAVFILTKKHNTYTYT